MYMEKINIYSNVINLNALSFEFGAGQAITNMREVVITNCPTAFGFALSEDDEDYLFALAARDEVGGISLEDLEKKYGL